MRNAPILIATLLVPAAWISGGAARAADSPATYGVADPGVATCRLVLRMNELGPTGTERQLFNWAQGWFQGRAAASPGQAAPQLAEGGDERRRRYRQLLDWCGAHPNDQFGAAVAALWESMRAGR